MENLDINSIIDDDSYEYKEVSTPIKESKTINKKITKVEKLDKEETLINCLRNNRVIVRHLPKTSGMFNGKNHVFSGGMADNVAKTFTVPINKANTYINPLTESERQYLEYIMGLESNTLSIYNRVNNFWENFEVRLTKGDNYLDLSSPDDYIKYKVLLINTDYIAKSTSELEDKYKVTYQFVLINEGDELKDAKNNLSITMQCYKAFGKIENEADKLRVIIELIKGVPVSNTSSLDFLQTEINDLITTDGKRFLSLLKDEYLDNKVLIKKCIEKGLIVKRGDYLYLSSTNTPLCNAGEDPTFNVAAKFLALPKNQEMKFSLEAKLKD